MAFLVMEYEALRSEILDHLGTARTMVGSFLLSLGAIGGFAVSGRATPKILVMLPLLSAVFWWVHLDTRMIVAVIGRYIASRLAPRARALGSKESLAWEEWLRASTKVGPRLPSAFWVFKFSTGLDGSAWPIYLLPSLLSLSLTAEGATTPILLFTDQFHSSFYYPVWLWWIGALFHPLLVWRALAIERSWWKAGHRSWHLTKELAWTSRRGTNVIVPAGFVTDFTSIPQISWWWLPSSERCGRTAVVHDYLYWLQDRPRKEADGIMLEGMEDCGITRPIRWIIYRSLRLSGYPMWRSNKKKRKRGEKRIHGRGSLKLYPFGRAVVGVRPTGASVDHFVPAH